MSRVISSPMEMARVYENCIALNRRLIRGREVLLSEIARDGGFLPGGCSCDIRLRYPRIGIYVGEGASHSWLWFAEILDRMGFYEVVFLDEKDVRENALSPLDVLLVSGGDTFALAGALGEKGSESIKNFIDQGGLYFGTCAGAYLPLTSSKPPLNLFNFIDMKISNISSRIHGSQPLEKRYCTSYGCDLVLHALREEVRLSVADGGRSDGRKELIAPMYGGPSLLPSEHVETLARYRGFTRKTKFFVDEEIAREIFIGKIAVARKAMGAGSLCISGPHLEHPDYALCNGYIAGLIYDGNRNGPERIRGEEWTDEEAPLGDGELNRTLRELKRALSNARISSSWSDPFTGSWKIGEKYYGFEKIAFFMNFIWNKFRVLETIPDLQMAGQRLSRCIEISESVKKSILDIKSGLSENSDTTQLAAKLFAQLKKLCSTFLCEYFRARRNFFFTWSGN